MIGRVEKLMMEEELPETPKLTCIAFLQEGLASFTLGWPFGQKVWEEFNGSVQA